MNPQSYSSGSLTPRMMYSYDRGYNKSWNMPEYKTPRIYQDPMLQRQKRVWATQKKGVKDTTKYVTKRGFYMDYHIKVSKSVPGSNVHNSQEPWSFKKQQEKAKSIKIDPNLSKNTYIQQIQREEVKRKKPGIGTYSLQKSLLEKSQEIQKLKQKVLKASEKRYFYQNTQNLSQSVPGAGNYNPHDSVQHLKKQRMSYKLWIDKHKKQDDRIRKRNLSIPGSSTYKPLYQSFQTFDKTNKTPVKSLSRKNGFGSDARFPYIRPNKKQIKQVRPSPTTYDTSMKWRGKSEKKKSKAWHQVLWKGSMSESIYRSS